MAGCTDSQEAQQQQPEPLGVQQGISLCCELPLPLAVPVSVFLPDSFWLLIEVSELNAWFVSPLQSERSAAVPDISQVIIGARAATPQVREGAPDPLTPQALSAVLRPSGKTAIDNQNRGGQRGGWLIQHRDAFQGFRGRFLVN